MSYYEYNPNYYYYEDYPDFDVFNEEPNIEYRLPQRENRHCGKPVLGNILDENRFFQHKPSRYVVPVIYAPTRMPNIHKFEDMDDENLQERMDLYYSDRRNLEREAMLFEDYAEPYYCVSTIQEETESSTTYADNSLKNEIGVSSCRPITITDNRSTMEAPEKWKDTSQKIQKTKKKKCGTNSEVVNLKKYRKGGKSPKPGASPGKKLESSTSWTTVPSSTFTTNKSLKQTDVTREINREVLNNPLVKKSKSLVCMHLKSKASVKCQVKCDESVQNVKEKCLPELRVEKDTDKISNELNMKEGFQSVCNVKSIAEKTTKPTEMVGWRNKEMKQESSISESSKISLEQEVKSSDIPPDSSDSTDITINSDEYKHFIESINKPLRPRTPLQKFSTGIQLDIEKPTQTENPKDGVIHNAMVSERSSSNSFFERFVKATHFVEEKRYGGRKVNPLAEVPLGMSKNTMFYVPTIIMTDLPIILKDNCEKRMISRKRSLFLRIVRNLADLIANIQNVAYKYVFRYILFV